MSKAIITITLIAICFIPVSAYAVDNTVSSNDLIDNASEYDGQTIVYTGEVIGDIMSRGDYTWLNISDGSNAIGVWVKSADMQDIKIAGRYDNRGDIVKITGIFYRACANHGGDFDIHANSIEIVERGYYVSHKIEAWKVIMAIFLFTGAIACMTFVLRKKLIK